MQCNVIRVYTYKSYNNVYVYIYNIYIICNYSIYYQLYSHSFSPKPRILLLAALLLQRSRHILPRQRLDLWSLRAERRGALVRRQHGRPQQRQHGAATAADGQV